MSFDLFGLKARREQKALARQEELKKYTTLPLYGEVTIRIVDSTSDIADPDMMSKWAHDLFDGVFGAERVENALNTIKYYDKEDWKRFLEIKYYEEGKEEDKKQKWYKSYVNSLVGLVDSDGIIHMRKESSIHTVVHELMHLFSEIKAREMGLSMINGQGETRKVTGIREYFPDGKHTTYANETLTEYLTAKYTDGKYLKWSIYRVESTMAWETIDDAITEQYGSKASNYLLNCYMNNDTASLKEYFESHAYENAYYDFAVDVVNYKTFSKSGRIVRQIKKTARRNRLVWDD